METVKIRNGYYLIVDGNKSAHICKEDSSWVIMVRNTATAGLLSQIEPFPTLKQATQEAQLVLQG